LHFRLSTKRTAKRRRCAAYSGRRFEQEPDGKRQNEKRDFGAPHGVGRQLIADNQKLK
jgi:hypothetical protein